MPALAASCRLPLAACRLPPAACRLPPASCRLPLAAFSNDGVGGSDLSFLADIFHLIGCIYLVLVRHHIVSVLAASPSDAGGNAADGSAAGGNDFESGNIGDGRADAIDNEWIPYHLLDLRCLHARPNASELTGAAGSCDSDTGMSTYFFSQGRAFEAWVFCFFFAMSVVIGAKSPFPTTAAQTAFFVPVVFIGFLLYAWLIGSFTSALTQISAVESADREEAEFINQASAYIHVLLTVGPPLLRRRRTRRRLLTGHMPPFDSR